jgi:hypothetical protein
MPFQLTLSGMQINSLDLIYQLVTDELKNPCVEDTKETIGLYLSYLHGPHSPVILSRVRLLPVLLFF